MDLFNPAQRFLQGVGNTLFTGTQEYGKQIGGGGNIQLTKNRTNAAIKNLQEQQARMVEQQKRVDATQRAKLRQAVAGTQKEIDRNVAEQRNVVSKNVRDPLDTLGAAAMNAAEIPMTIAAVTNPVALGKLALGSGVIGGAVTGVLGGDVAQGAGEFVGRAPAINAVTQATNPLLAGTLGKYSLPIQKFLSQKGLGAVSQPLVNRGFPAILNAAQGVPVNIAIGQKPISPESLATDLATGALFRGGTFGSAKKLLAGGEPLLPGKTTGQLQEASQRQRGLGLLADFDNASRTRDPLRVQQAARAILASDEPQYVDYKKPIGATLERYADAGKPKTLGQVQQENQNPDLTKYENALNDNDLQILDVLGKKYPQDTRFQMHKLMNLEPNLEALTTSAMNRTNAAKLDLTDKLFKAQEQVNPQQPGQGVNFLKTPLYHGTTADASKMIENAGFDVNKTADGTIWFTDNIDAIKQGKVAASGKGAIVKRIIDDKKLKLGGWEETDKYSTDELINMGYDGLKLPGEGEITYQIFHPQKLIKGIDVDVPDKPVRFLTGAPKSKPNLPGSLENPTAEVAQPSFLRSQMDAVNKATSPLIDFESSIQSNKKEAMAFFNAKGENMYQTKVGGKYSAKIPVEDAGKTKGATVTSHNHRLVDPKNPNSQLNQIAVAPDMYDIKQAIDNGVKEVRTVSPLGVISNKIPDNLDATKVRGDFEQASIAGQVAYKQAIARGEQPYYANVRRVKAENDTLVKGLGITVSKIPATDFLKSAPEQKTSLFKTIQQKLGGLFGGGKKPPAAPPAPPVTEPGGVQRGFITTVKESPVATPQLKAAVSGTYTPKANADLLADANARIAKDPIGATQFAMKEDNDESVATAIQLVKKLSSEGNNNAAADIVNQKAAQLTEAGRTIQAASLFDSLSPEGVVHLAAREIQKYNTVARQKIPELTGQQFKILQDMAKKYQLIPKGPKKDLARTELLQKIADQIPPSRGERASAIIEAYRYQNMLSGPRTHERNIYQNLFNTLVTRPMDLAFEATWDRVRHPFNPMARDAALSEIPGYYKNVTVSLPNAVHAAIQGFKQGYKGTELDLGTGSTKSLLQTARRQNIRKTVPGALKVVTGAMEAEDKFFQTLIASGEYNRLLERGVSGEAAQTQAKELAQQYLMRGKLGQGSEDPAFTRAIDSLGRFALKGRQFPVIGKPYSWFVPFITTPVNAAKSMVSHSPIGLIGGSHSSAQMGKALSGSMVTAFGALLAMEGKTTWAAPTDPKHKDYFYATNRKPFSVNINGKDIPMWYFGPYALALALPAAAKYYQDESRTALTDSQLTKLTRATADLSKFVINQTPLQGVGGFFQMLEGDTNISTENLLGFTAGQVIPAQGLINWVNQQLDPVYRKSSGFLPTIQKSIPGLSTDLKPYTSPEGLPQKRSLFNSYIPYDVGVRDSQYEEDYQKRGKELQQNAIENKAEKQATEAVMETGKSQKAAGRLFYLEDGKVRSKTLTPKKPASSYKAPSLFKAKSSASPFRKKKTRSSGAITTTF